GDAARITQITDVVEPRAKSGGTGGVFPGLLSPVEPAGGGRTDRLRGVAVVTSGEVPWLGSKGLFVAHDSVLDTAGPGAGLHPNELADGALTSGGLGGHGAKMHTWMHQNNAVVERLMAGHGTRWDFAGVVLHRGHFYLYEDKQRVALRIAETATLLGAAGAIFT